MGGTFEIYSSSFPLTACHLKKREVTKFGDIHVPVFRVKICVWRNPVLTDYLKYIDKESQNPAIRPSRGSKLHPRIQIDEPGQTPAPKRLPQCLYKEDWLKGEEEVKGKEWVEEELEVSREVFELLEFVAHVNQQ